MPIPLIFLVSFKSCSAVRSSPGIAIVNDVVVSGHNVFGNISHLSVGSLRCSAKYSKGFLRRDPLAFHQDAEGLTDQPAALKCNAKVQDLTL